MIFFNASIANKGMVNSAITRIEDTALNLLYIGTKSMKKSVGGMKFLPQESIIEQMVVPKSAHFIVPFTIKQPKKKRNNTKAPTYTGPAVPGWSPKYWGNAPYKLLYLGFALVIAVLFSLMATVAPPLKLGTNKVSVSSTP